MIEIYQTRMPLVSVIIPAYNAEALITKTLESVLRQTYQHIEVLVVDDGSCDRTPNIVKEFAQRDCRVHLLQQANAGVAAARNLGIQHARGEFIAPIDADDIWYPQNVERQVQCFLESSSTVGLVYSWSAFIDEADVPTGGFCAFCIQGNIFLTLLCFNFLGNASATMIRRSCLEKVGTYSTELRSRNAQGCEDWDLYLRLAEHYQFGVVPEFLVGYRKLQNSMSRNSMAMADSWYFVLESACQRHPEVHAFLHRTSMSYFLLYLAQECDGVGDAKTALQFTRSAFQVNWLMSLIRPNLYRLMLNNGWRLILRRSWRSQTEGSAPTKLTSQTVKSSRPVAMPTGLRLQLKILLFVLPNHFYYVAMCRLARLRIQLPTLGRNPASLARRPERWKAFTSEFSARRSQGISKEHARN